MVLYEAANSNDPLGYMCICTKDKRNACLFFSQQQRRQDEADTYIQYTYTQIALCGKALFMQLFVS